MPENTAISHPGTNLIRAPWEKRPRGMAQWIWRLADLAASNRTGDNLAGTLYRLGLRCERKGKADANWRHAFASAHAFHLVGGGYLTGLFDLPCILRPIRVARAMNLPVTTSPLGIGPFADPKAPWAVARALRGVRVLVRDEASLRLCQSHGLTAEERPDDGFRLREVMDFGPEPPPSSPHRIGVCIFPQHSPRWSSRIEDWWTDCLRALARSLPDCRIEGFCFHTNRDMDFETTRQLFVRAGLDPNGVQPPTPDFRAAITQLRNFSALISTRFHSVVTASVLKIPCVAIALDDYYEVKMRSVIREASSPILLVNPIQSAPEAAVRFFHERIQGRANRPR